MALNCSKKLLALLRGITSKDDSTFYCLNRLHSFRTKSKLESHKKSRRHFFKDTEILEFNQYQKSGKKPFSIYADLESLIKNGWM